jgi:hypothetical protein
MAGFTEPVQVYLTVAQKQLMRESAMQVGLSDAAFCRQAILTQIARLQQEKAEREANPRGKRKNLG